MFLKKKIIYIILVIMFISSMGYLHLLYDKMKIEDTKFVLNSFSEIVISKSMKSISIDGKNFIGQDCSNSEFNCFISDNISIITPKYCENLSTYMGWNLRGIKVEKFLGSATGPESDGIFLVRGKYINLFEYKFGKISAIYFSNDNKSVLNLIENNFRMEVLEQIKYTRVNPFSQFDCV